MINLGNITIKDLRLGSTQIKDVYLGNVQVWGNEEPVPPTPTDTWLCFTAEEADSTVKLYKYQSGAPTLDIETSTDGSNWTAYTQGTVLTAANVGDKVYFRAGSTGNSTVSTTNKTNRFTITGKMAASGDLQYLLSQDGTTQPTGAWCFNCLFYHQTALTEPPKCGATTLGQECYGGTFEGCTNLRHAPELMATNFAGQKVYINMFAGCTSLTTAPKLPATALTLYCYNGMFDGCTSLSSVEVAFTSWSSNSTSSWLRNVAATGTFTCPAALPDTRGASNIPEGWTKVDAT